MRKACLARILVIASLAVVPAALGGSSATLPGRWQLLPPAPIAPNDGLASVWTGRQLILVGRALTIGSGGAIVERRNVAAAYDTASGTWRRLPSPSVTDGFMGLSAAWTGKEVLVWGQGTRLAFTPRTNRWRTFPTSRLLSIHDGFGTVVWTGHELIGWGGGCCGDAFDDGVAYNPATNAWRAIPRSPLTAGGGPGVWTGHEFILTSRDVDPDGKRYPARLARAAAYNPTTNSWRRLPAPPALNGAATWDGREMLVIGAGKNADETVAYKPAANHWRRLADLPTPRFGEALAWTGSRVLLWGGYVRSGTGYPVIPQSGLTFDPATNRWAPLPRAPLAGRYAPTAVWTGHSFIVWGGTNPRRPVGTGTRYYSDGAAFTPAS